MNSAKAKYDKAYNKRTVADRVKRNQARAMVLKELTAKYGASRAASMMKGKDVAHNKSVRSGGGNSKSNLKLQSVAVNRGRKGEGARRKGARVKTVMFRK